jgi:hypothetical protein
MAMEIKQPCLQCGFEKPIDEFFIYKKSGKPYRWCKDCVRKSSSTSKIIHAEKAKMFRERWA